MNTTQLTSRPIRLAVWAWSGLAMIFAAQTALSQQARPAIERARDIPSSIAAAETSPLLDDAPQFGAAGSSTNSEEEDAGTAAHSGIKVHGHWVIDVRNPDGTLAQHRAFENSLQPTGGQALALLLGGVGVGGDWAIVLDPAGGTSSCGSSDCFLLQSKTGLMGSYICTLDPACIVGVVEKTNLATVPYSIVLMGQYTAPQAGVVAAVNTLVGFCTTAPITLATSAPDTTIAPAACVTQTVNDTTVALTPFTGTTITPVPITAGQFVQVSVTLTFS